MTKFVLTFLSVCSGAACLFFAWYTVRLIWVNVAVAETASHRQTGMYIGAVAFPVAVLVFGYICRACWKRART